ncbi:Cytochrome P450 6B4 [Frankliniella fusca]|uniref:Cytochrome P450 6B4 n=1 Tax=Frankliniella fusca TaxID=407009 RepID=A0AAE1H3M3_9NEOP|nr:Cytochrome P450 6B4 [Frankliniella fusca]
MFLFFFLFYRNFSYFKSNSKQGVTKRSHFIFVWKNLRESCLKVYVPVIALLSSFVLHSSSLKQIASAMQNTYKYPETLLLSIGKSIF